MNATLFELFRIEEDRIRAAYARRVTESLYSSFNLGHLFLLQERERQVLALLRRYGFADLGSKRILEVGCGTGFWVREFVKWGANPEDLTGVDLLADRIHEARRLCPSGVSLTCNSAINLELPDTAFDMVLLSTVFTSILDTSMKMRIASEMLRVLKPDGMILWYDYHVNNPANPDVRGVRKREIKELFPDCHIDLRSITLAPPLLRLLAPHSWLACYLLSKLPLLCTHYIGAIRKG